MRVRLVVVVVVKVCYVMCVAVLSKKNQSFRRFAELDVISTPLLLTGRPRFFPFVSACLSTDSGLNWENVKKNKNLILKVTFILCDFNGRPTDRLPVVVVAAAAFDDFEPFWPFEGSNEDDWLWELEWLCDEERLTLSPMNPVHSAAPHRH